MDSKNSPLILGTEKVNRLLAQYAVPAIIAMTATSLYNITDSIFIGHGVGALAISGLAITFPLMNLSTAVGTLVGVGASTLLSVRLGQKDYDTANNILGNVFVLNIIMGILFSLISFIFLDPILYFFGASSATIPYARDFMEIILLGNFVTHLYFGLNAMLRSSGRPDIAMKATILSVIINLIFNPLFIFGLGWGIRGSALATVISQTAVLLWQIYIFNRKDSFLRLKKGGLRLRRRIVNDTFAIGMSPFLMNAAACVIVILVNQGLMKYGGDMAVGAYGIVNRTAFLFIMVVMGLNQGMQPIAGYNFGARQYERVTEVFRLTSIFAVIVMTLGFLVAELCPHLVTSIFTTDEALIDFSVRGLRITFLCFPVVGFSIVASTLFQSIGMVKKAIFLSLTRQIIFLIPLLLILPAFFNVDGIWISMCTSDFLATILSVVMIVQLLRQFKNKDSI
jgi:putative MATE family efflux protein